MFYQSLQHVRCKGCQPDMRRRRVPVGARKSGDIPMRRQRWSGSACSKEGGSEISSDSASIRPCWDLPSKSVSARANRVRVQYISVKNERAAPPF